MNSTFDLLLESIRKHVDIDETCEDDEEVLDEDNTSSSVEGYDTPYAFGSSNKKKDAVYSKRVPKTNRFYVKMGESIDRIDKQINQLSLSELNYPDFKSDQSRTDRQKINLNIKLINARLSEVEQMINHAGKLKLETGSDNTVFWRGTVDRFSRINEKLSRLSNKIREMTA